MFQRRSFPIELLAFIAAMVFIWHEVKWDTAQTAARLREEFKKDLAQAQNQQGARERETASQSPSELPGLQKLKELADPKRDFKKRYVKRNPAGRPPGVRDFEPELSVSTPQPNTVVGPDTVRAFKMEGTCSGRTVTIRFPGMVRYAICNQGRYSLAVNLETVPDGNFTVSVMEVDRGGTPKMYGVQYSKKTSGDDYSDPY